MLEPEARSAPQGHLIGAVCENQNVESGFKGKESLLGSQDQFSGQILGQLGVGKKITSRGKAREATPPPWSPPPEDVFLFLSERHRRPKLVSAGG